MRPAYYPPLGISWRVWKKWRQKFDEVFLRIGFAVLAISFVAIVIKLLTLA
jgi:hypothetical protein